MEVYWRFSLIHKQKGRKLHLPTPYNETALLKKMESLSYQPVSRADLNKGPSPCKVAL